MKNKYVILLISLQLLFPLIILSEEQKFITIETEPSSCQVTVYEWVPREGNKGEVIAEGESPLKIPEAILKKTRGIVVTVETNERVYLNSEQSFFAPYKFAFDILKVKLQKEVVYVNKSKEKKTQYGSGTTYSSSSNTYREDNLNADWYKIRIKSLPDKKGSKYEKEIAYYKEKCLFDAIGVSFASDHIKIIYKQLQLSTLSGSYVDKNQINEEYDKIKKWVRNMLELAQIYSSSGDNNTAIKVCDILISCPYAKWDATLADMMPDVLKAKRNF